MDDTIRNSDACLSEILLEIMAHFISIPPELVNPAIETAQRRICECSNLDRASVWQWSQKNPHIIYLSHVYQAPDVEVSVIDSSGTYLRSDSPELNQQSESSPILMHMEANKLFPWVVGKIRRSETIVLPTLDELPEEAALDREMFQQYATKSSLIIPLRAGGNQLGCIAFASTRCLTTWTALLIKRLEQVAQVIAGALERKRSYLNLRDSEMRLTLAAEAADISLWSLFPQSGRIWTTDNFWKLFGVSRGNELMLPRLLGMIHPDDRAAVADALENSRQTGQKIDLEYRLLSDNGAVHWVVTRGELQNRDNGETVTLSGVIVDITGRKMMEEQLRQQFQEIERLRNKLEQENRYLQGELKILHPSDKVVARSAVMKEIMAQATQVARTDSTVLILGETGTGKELLARAIHDQSPRKNRALITVNCASLPPTLIEAELFGREKGAYTGALTRTTGRFELADKSTIFLDEIGEMPLELQAKLLRVIENGSFERLGSSTPITVDMRIIAATNRDLALEVREGRFRADLFYRLNVFPLTIPPLRERAEDIPPMVWALVNEIQQSMGTKIEQIPEPVMKLLTSYGWPGNARELRNVIERAMILNPGPILEIVMPNVVAQQTTSPEKSLAAMDREHILAVLESTGWRMTGNNGAPALLGLERTTLYSKMKKLGISRPKMSK